MFSREIGNLGKFVAWTAKGSISLYSNSSKNKGKRLGFKTQHWMNDNPYGKVISNNLNWCRVWRCKRNTPTEKNRLRCWNIESEWTVLRGQLVSQSGIKKCDSLCFQSVCNCMKFQKIYVARHEARNWQVCLEKEISQQSLIDSIRGLPNKMSNTLQQIVPDKSTLHSQPREAEF